MLDLWKLTLKVGKHLEDTEDLKDIGTRFWIGMESNKKVIGKH